MMARSLDTNMMPSSPGKNFRKTAACPSSQSLLRYRRHRLPILDRAAIEIHLRACDFCSAELQLLMRHRSSEEEYRLVEIPRQLRKLAEDLLTCTATQLPQVGFSSNQSH